MVAVYGWIIISCFFTEVCHIFSIHAKRYRTFSHFVTAGYEIDGYILVCRFGRYIFSLKPFQCLTVKDVWRHIATIYESFLCVYTIGKIVNGIDILTRDVRGIITSGVVVGVEHIESYFSVFWRYRSCYDSLLGTYFPYLAFTVVACVGMGCSHLPCSASAFAEIEGETKVDSKVWVPFICRLVCLSVFKVEVGLKEYTSCLNVEWHTLWFGEETAILEFEMTRPFIVRAVWVPKSHVMHTTYASGEQELIHKLRTHIAFIA